MGNCAGCTNPDRRLRTDRTFGIQQPSQPLQSAYDLTIRKTNSKEQILSNSMHAYTQPSQFRPKYAAQDPWKSRIASRTVKKYVRMPTLQEEEQANREKENSQSTDPAPIFVSFKANCIPTILNDKPIRIESFEESIVARNNIDDKEMPEEYKMQYNQGFCDEPDEIKEMFEGSSSAIQFSSPQTISNEMYQQGLTISRPEKYQPPSGYFPRKQQKMRERQLEQIMELVQKDAETPVYVKNIRKEQGEDVKMNNFPKFDAVGHFEWFSIGKYLTQIDKQANEESFDRNKLADGSKALNQRSGFKSITKPNLIISIDEQAEQ